LEVIEQESERLLNWYPPRREKENPSKRAFEHRESPSKWVIFEAKRTSKVGFFRASRENRECCIVYRRECDSPKAFDVRFARYRIKSGGLVERRFRTLADEWKRETKFVSAPNQMFLVPSYQRIIGLGPAAIPLILRELQQEPNHWFWALTALTGDNPVRPEDLGNVRAMRRAWTEWGRERGYL
jgi:hypothetical protein